MKENNQMITQDQDMIDFENTQKLCKMLMQTPHYAKMGAEGIFAIIENAKELGIPARKALNGGMYFVQGKVEMSSRLMSAIIRSKGHSVTIDKTSNEKICIVHGKRKDSGDTCTATFTIEEAVRAGLANRGPWKTFPSDMLFARALSRLGRRLFSDVIGNCYSEGEISLDPNIKSPISELPCIEAPSTERLSEEDYKTLSFHLDQLPDYKATIEEFLEKKGITNLWEMPEEMMDKVIEKCKEKITEEEGRD